MTLYLNKGKRTFVLKQKNNVNSIGNVIYFKPNQVIDLDDDNYNRISNYPEVVPLKTERPKIETIAPENKKTEEDDKKTIKTTKNNGTTNN